MSNVRPLVLMGMLLGAVLAFQSPARAQESASSHRAVLLPFVGQEVLVIDSTGGMPQYQSSDALALCRLTLNAVRKDYIIVSREVEGDRRSFVYPLTVIRRVTTASGGVPLRPILIEMY